MEKLIIIIIIITVALWRPRSDFILLIWQPFEKFIQKYVGVDKKLKYIQYNVTGNKTLLNFLSR